MMSPLEIAIANAKTWGHTTVVQLKQSAGGNVDSGELLRSIKFGVNMSKRYGHTIRVTFTFKRHGIFLAKGASRGYGGRGSEWITATGEKVRTDPKSLGKMNTGNRKAVNWLEPVIKSQLELLAEDVGQIMDTQVQHILNKIQVVKQAVN